VDAENSLNMKSNLAANATRFPVRSLRALISANRERYGMSMVENAKMVKEKGMEEFLKSQAERQRCPSCGSVICVHDGKCYSCGYVLKKPLV
jgi:hypothetical protein